MSGVYSTVANYGGRQPSNSSYIKQFTTTIQNFMPYFIEKINGVINVVFNYNVEFLKNITVYGTINNPSDISLKQKIKYIDNKLNKDVFNLMYLKPITYTLKSDTTDKIHYGFIAQELERLYPELVNEIYIHNSINTKIKTVNYLELIPLLLAKIQFMQKELDALKI
jgi:hypothetical protein